MLRCCVVVETLPRETRLARFKNEPCRNIHSSDDLGCGVAKMQPHAYQVQIRHTHQRQPDLRKQIQADGTLTDASLHPAASLSISPV